MPIHLFEARYAFLNATCWRWVRVSSVPQRRSWLAAFVPLALRAILTAITASTASAGVTNAPGTDSVPPVITSTSVITTGLSTVQPVAWSPDSRHFAVLGSKGADRGKTTVVMVYEADRQRLVTTLKVNTLGVALGDVAFSPDGKYLIGGTGAVTVWDAATWQPIREILGPFERGEYASGGIDSIAVSPDSRSVTILYKSVIFPESVRVGAREDIAAVARRLLKSESGEIAQSAQALMSFDIETTRRRFTVRMFKSVPGHAGHMTANITYTPDGKYLLSTRVEYPGETDVDHRPHPFLEYRDALTGQVVREVASPHVMALTAVAADHAGGYVATGTSTTDRVSSLDRATGQWHLIDNADPIRLWNVADGSLAAELGQLRGAVRCLAFGPGDRLLVSAQTDLASHETIWLWDVRHAQLVQRLKTPRSAYDFSHLAISPDGHYIAMPVTDVIYLFQGHL